MMPTIITPAFQEELQERGAVLMTEGQAMLELARCLGKFEDATGQRLAVVDALQVQADATIIMPMAETITDPDPVPDADGDMMDLVEPDPSLLEPSAPMPGPAPDPSPLVEPEEPAEPPEPVIPEPAAFEPVTDAAAPQPAAPWSSDEEAAARSMQAKGFSPSHIAKVLRRPLRQLQPLLSMQGSATAEPAPAPAATDPAPTFAKLTGRQQRLVDHVGRLADTFEPADDLWLVESFAKGAAIDVIADQLGCDVSAVRSRFKAMLTDEITTPKGMITIDGQADLLAALRYRAGD